MDFRRRELLCLGSTAGVIGLSGCAGVFGENGSSSDDSDGDTRQGGESTDGEPTIDNDASKPQENSSVAAVSNHHLATDAGLDILAEGGTAADAAVTVASVLSIVEPWFSSVLGGGTWALYYDAESDEITSLDGVGPVGAEATLDDYEARARESGIHQAIVPGAWDGWMLWLDRYGNRELGDVLAPAIEIAREGYPASSEMSKWLDIRAYQINQRPTARRIYTTEGQFLEAGETVYQRDMADTFEALIDSYDSQRDEGRTEAIQAARDYFYRGPIAEAIVGFSAQNDGYLTLPDFHNFEAEIVDPISIDYDTDVRVYQNPPNSQGITMLLALNILKEYDFNGMDPDGPDTIHLQAEAIKLAFADRYHHVGDPERVDIPVAKLLSDEYAAHQRDRIKMDQVMEWPIDTGLTESLSTDSEAGHTTTFHIVDQEGNAAAVTTSLGAEFLVVGETGIHINNRMRMTEVREDNPNQLTPGYKVRHTSNPYMAFQNEQLYILGGNTGVDTQPQGQAQQFIQVVEFDLGPQDAVSHPRFVSTAFPSGTYPYGVKNTLQMEHDFPERTIDALRERGHNVTIGNGIFGAANMLVLEDAGEQILAGAEPRTSTSKGVVSSFDDS